MVITVGVFFGGGRSRETSFSSGRTICENLDKNLFRVVPVFVDLDRRWYHLDWKHLYQNCIPDFFPPASDKPKSELGLPIYQESLGPLDELALEEMGRKIGRRIRRYELPELIDVAFLALHNEDGQLQHELEYANIPYTGSDVRASELGVNKVLRKKMMIAKGFKVLPSCVIPRADFDPDQARLHYTACTSTLNWPVIVRPVHQDGSIGASVIGEKDGFEAFQRAVNAAFFREVLPLNEYRVRDDYERLEYVRLLSDLRDGLAFPLDATFAGRTITLYTPDELYEYLENILRSQKQSEQDTQQAQQAFPSTSSKTTNGEELRARLQNEPASTEIHFTALQTTTDVIVESTITGEEFSCLVVRTDEGNVVAFPPTRAVMPAGERFDFRDKSPLNDRELSSLPADRIPAIRAECERFFTSLGFGVCARISGVCAPSGEIILTDPNTSTGLSPTSFYFRQAAGIGLTPCQFLTFIIRQSLRERGMQGQGQEAMEVAVQLGDALDQALAGQRSTGVEKERIAVLFDGMRASHKSSVAAARNVYEKLAASASYLPAEFIEQVIGYSKAQSERFGGGNLPASTSGESYGEDTPDTSVAPPRSNVPTFAPAAAAPLSLSNVPPTPPTETALSATSTNAFMDHPEENLPEDLNPHDGTPELPVNQSAEAPALHTEPAGYEHFKVAEEATDDVYVAQEAASEKATEAATFASRAKAFAASGGRLLISGYFWKNLLAALLFFVLCFFALRVGMSWYTAHGKSTQLPDFIGMQKEEALQSADDLGLKLKFEKGPFDPNRPPGQVVLQHPKAGAGVKKNRSIYLTVLSDEAPLITLPPLVGNYDYTQYTTKIERMGDIRSTIREQVYDPKQEENTILHFFDGETKVTDQMVRAGYQVPQGGTLEFVVSVRQTGEVAVPKFKCKRFGTVEFLLDASDLLVGTIHGNVADRSEAFVVRTEPPGGKMVPVGSKMDIYLSAREPDGCE